MTPAGQALHLARRLVGSLSPRRPDPRDAAWATDRLGPGERALWARMAPADQRHAIAVARRAVALLGGRADRPVVAAALLHDVGKVEADLGTWARVAVTLGAAGLGRARLAAGDGRVGRYLRHDALGATLLRGAGAPEVTWRWAEEHHLPASRWTVPSDAGRALKAADDD